MTGDIGSNVVDAVAAEGISVLIKPFAADELLPQITRLHKGSKSGDPGSPGRK